MRGRGVQWSTGFLAVWMGLLGVLLGVLLGASDARAEDKGKRGRLAFFFEAEPGVGGDPGMDNPNPGYSFGIDHVARVDRATRYHLKVGYKQMDFGFAQARGFTFSPGTIGIGVPLVESGGFTLELEVQLNIMKIDFYRGTIPNTLVPQSDRFWIIDFSSGAALQISATIGDALFIGVNAAAIDLQWAIGAVSVANSATGTAFAGSQSGVGFNYPIGIFVGVQYGR